MRAVVFRQFGSPDVLQVEETAKPVPKDHEVLIKVRATTVTNADCMMRRGDRLSTRLVLGLSGPRKKYRILGLELAGEIESVGKAVKRFKEGDQVFGFTGFNPGSYGEYKCLPEGASLAIKPTRVTFEEAAASADGASTALFFLRDKARLRSGERVLVYGASGSIGTFAVQLAKHLGAEVTGVCSTANLELVKSLGADKVIDYTREDFTRNGDTYDVIFDTVGKSSFGRCKGSLAPGGRYLVTVMGLVPVLQTLWTRALGGKRAIFAMSIEKAEALAFLRELIASGKLRTVIDRSYPLAQIAEAHRYVDEGHKRGNVAITV